VVENLSPIHIHFTKELTEENVIESVENGQFVVRIQQKATTVDIPFLQWISFWFGGSFRPFEGMFFPGDPTINRIWQAIRNWT
jgi:hypothetical protein